MACLNNNKFNWLKRNIFDPLTMKLEEFGVLFSRWGEGIVIVLFWLLIRCKGYHIAIALLIKKGFSSKNHDATLCVLIKYYNVELSKDDIELINKAYLDNNDILFYVQSKQEREKASYSSQTAFDKKLVQELRLKTILFVNKAKEILK